jgi:hypothetical protein
LSAGKSAMSLLIVFLVCCGILVKWARQVSRAKLLGGWDDILDCHVLSKRYRMGAVSQYATSVVWRDGGCAGVHGNANDGCVMLFSREKFT